jgi:DNA-binding NtrC family response regulator
MQRVAAQVQLARSGTAAVHVRGAAGTGKSHLVRQIFYGTEQKDKAFLPIDCQARPAELERLFNRLAELRPGEQLPGGLCLRRVDELPARFHQPLRQWLERVGSSVRIYSTATQSLDALVAADQFDAPLAAALTTLTIELPELSQRRSEIPLLAQQVLEQFNRGADQQFQGYSEEVLSLFSRYHWPGNLRELEQVVTTARNRSAGKTIEVEHLPVPFLASVRADDLPPAPEFPPLEEYLAHVERDLLQAALTAARGNKSLVAQWLRVPRPRLYRRLEALGLSEPTAMADPDRPATDPD